MSKQTVFTIEKDIPVPAIANARRYPFQDLQVGESFLVTDTSRNAMSGSICYAGKKLGRKFTARKLPEGVRIWRLL